jgi:hypothetical protein
VTRRSGVARKHVVHEGLRHVSASSVTLALLMEDGDAAHLNQAEMVQVLAEVAAMAPELLHGALEHRLVSLIADEISRRELRCPHSPSGNKGAPCATSR